MWAPRGSRGAGHGGKTRGPHRCPAADRAVGLARTSPLAGSPLQPPFLPVLLLLQGPLALGFPGGGEAWLCGCPGLCRIRSRTPPPLSRASSTGGGAVHGARGTKAGSRAAAPRTPGRQQSRAGRRSGTPQRREASQPPAAGHGVSGKGGGGRGAPEPPFTRRAARRAESRNESRAAESPSGAGFWEEKLGGAAGGREAGELGSGSSPPPHRRRPRSRKPAPPCSLGVRGLGHSLASRGPPALIGCRSPAPPGGRGRPCRAGSSGACPGPRGRGRAPGACTSAPSRAFSTLPGSAATSSPPGPSTGRLRVPCIVPPRVPDSQRGPGSPRPPLPPRAGVPELLRAPGPQHPGPQSGPGQAPSSPAGMLRLLALVLPLLPPPGRTREPSAQDVSAGVDWLTRYGYLPPPHPAQAQLQSPAKLRDAIKVMQRFAGLPETGLLDAVTMATMQRPRCSLPDVLGVAELVRRRRRRRYALSGSMWRKRTLTWRVRSFPQSSALTRETVRTLMHHALATWGIESGLRFQELVSQEPAEPDILIDFARAYHQDSYPFDGQGGTLAHAFFPGEHPISGDTHFDDEETWTYGSKDGEGTDLFAVAVHEFGHALGLGHSSAPNSIMRPFYQGPVGDPDKYRLSQDDREGLQQLYGKVPQTPYDKPTRKPLAPPPPPPALPPDSPSLPIPDRCDGSFDAIANIRGEIFFFKGPWFWRLQPSGQLVSPRPARLHRFWEGLPAQVKVIQAAYARHPDGRILLFSGPQFWVFQDRQLEGAPRPLTELGLPAGEEVDAVFSWPLNGKTYLIRGQRYWRYDEAAARPDPGYPRDLSLWEGAPHAPDDVTVSNTGDTYFFKGAHYWRFPKGSVKAEPDSPQPMGPKWLDCPAPSAGPRAPRPPKATLEPGTCDCSCEINQASGRPSLSFLLSLLALLVGDVASR